MDYSNDIDESVFEFEQFGKAICHPPEPFINVRPDLHVWERERDLPEFTKNFVIGIDVVPEIRTAIVDIIESHWDCFYGAGVQFPIVDHFWAPSSLQANIFDSRLSVRVRHVRVSFFQSKKTK